MSFKTWEKRGKRVATRLLVKSLGGKRNAGPKPNVADLESILVVRTQNQLGDLLLATPALRALRAHAPRARIDLVVTPANGDAVFGTPRVDEVIVYDKRVLRRRPFAARAFADRLRAPRYDLAIVLASVDFSMTSLWIAALARAKGRAGRAGAGDRERELAGEFFDWVLADPRPNRHQTAVNLDLLRELGVAPCGPEPEIFPTSAERARGTAVLGDALGAEGPGLRVVLHPGAGKIPNRWDAARFGAVAAALRSDGHRVAAAVGPREHDLLDALDRGAGAKIARLPSLEVRELAAAFGSADLVVANDTGVLHVAAASGAHVLALFGPTDPALWCPSSARVAFVRAPGGDLTRLEVASVMPLASGFARSIATGEPWPVGLSRAPSLDLSA